MTKRVVLIGHPVAHSLSGAMHQAAFDATGIDAAYELWDRAPMALPDAIAEIRDDAFLGANVTIPHKERVVPLVDRLTEDDASAFFRNRVMNLDKVYPYLPQCLARMLRRFAVGSCARYERAEQVVEDLGACMHALGWWRPERRRGRMA